MAQMSTIAVFLRDNMPLRHDAIMLGAKSPVDAAPNAVAEYSISIGFAAEAATGDMATSNALISFFDITYGFQPSKLRKSRKSGASRLLKNR